MSCCVGQGGNISFRDFSTFCAKAIAGIGKLPGTVADRAIPIRLKRTAAGEKVERFRFRNVKTEAARLSGQLAAWSKAHSAELIEACPALPEELTDRQQDGAEPLLTIADAAGGDWPKALRRALVTLCGGAQFYDDSSGVQLLADIHQFFDDSGVDRIASTDLASELAKIETSLWGEWSRGKPLTPIGLAQLLKPYEIGPHNIRIENKVLRGYERDDFKDAWGRYRRSLSASSFHFSGESATAATPSVSKDVARKESATSDADIATQKTKKHATGVACSDVAPSDPQPTRKGVVEAEI